MRASPFVFACLFVLLIAGISYGQDCCIRVTPGVAHPPDHTWQFDPADPDAPNLMMHAKLCLENCPTPPPTVIVTGVTLLAQGTGNSDTDINWVRVTYDLDCDGVIDSTDPLMAQTPGGFTSGMLTICNPALGVQLSPDKCICLIIEYNLKPDAPCDATYSFLLRSVLGGDNCQPLPMCQQLPLQSAVKTVKCDDCCLQVVHGPNHPADHTFNCVPGTVPEPNFMMQAKICNPCPTDEPIYGITLNAGGTGNPADVQQILVFVDKDCNGQPDSGNPALTGTFDSTGTAKLCSSTPIAVLGPAQATGLDCVCLLIYYQMKCPSTPGTYYFDLTSVLGPNCQPRCAEVLPIRSAVKTVVDEQPCCLEVGYGPNQPADHTFNCVPGTVPEPNFMMHARICNPCPQDMPIHGITLQAGGTGNIGDVQQIMVFVDKDCDGKPDSVAPALTGTFDAAGRAVLCDPNAPLDVLLPASPDGLLDCTCLLIYYQMKCPSTPGTYYFDLTSVLGPNCEPVCAEPLPIRSAVKTVVDQEPCCLEVSKGPHFPPDHVYFCDATVPNAPNFMAEYRICNPCPDPVQLGGLQITAGGTGPLSGIQSVVVSIDYNCDGKPDVVNALSGSFLTGSPVLDLCKQGAAIWLKPGQCICVRIEYIMHCDAPAGTYWFNLTALLGPDCKPVCAEVLPIQSAVKTIESKPCCLEVSPGPMMPQDHHFDCVAGQNEPNFMQHIRICNPCDVPMDIYGIKLQAYGSGNDLTGISQIMVGIDKDCDGVPESWVLSGVYTADDGTATLCSTTGAPIVTLQPGECICLGVYYRMKCPDPVPGTYLFVLTDILGQNCVPLCADTLPIKSAVKTVDPKPCCLEVSVGPANPPSHIWWPGMPIRNRMFQFKICNPCTEPAVIRCVSLQASGTGNDKNDIFMVRVFVDTNCNGKVDPGEPLFGTGAYPADNGTLTIFTTTPVTLPPAGVAGPSCACFLVEYIMKPWPKPKPPIGATYCMALTGICAINSITGADFCVEGLPLKSNCKKRCHKIWEINHLVPGTKLCLPHKIVTANFQDRYYVQDLYKDDATEDQHGSSPDPTAGVAVLGMLNLSATGGEVVDIEGIVDVVNCEVVIRPTSEQIVSTSEPVKPLGMNNRSTGGGRNGLQSPVVDSFFDVFFSVQTNNIGLLVKTWGTVTAVDSLGNFWVDDGSHLSDGTHDASGKPNVGVKVNATQAGFVPAEGSTVTVQGIVRAEDYQGKCIRVLYPRTRADIIVAAP